MEEEGGRRWRSKGAGGVGRRFFFLCLSWYVRTLCVIRSWSIVIVLLFRPSFVFDTLWTRGLLSIPLPLFVDSLLSLLLHITPLPSSTCTPVILPTSLLSFRQRPLTRSSLCASDSSVFASASLFGSRSRIPRTYMTRPKRIQTCAFSSSFTTVRDELIPPGYEK